MMHFDLNIPVTVLTDASRLHSLGHFIDGRFRVAACGSKSVTPTQQCYATIELECLGVQFALDKCAFYLPTNWGEATGIIVYSYLGLVFRVKAT